MTPEKFAEILCEDLELSVARFVPLIAESIRNQVVDFEAIHEVELPPDSIRVVINVCIHLFYFLQKDHVLSVCGLLA